MAWPTFTGHALAPPRPRPASPPTKIYYEALVTDHDQGKYAALLQAPMHVAHRSRPILRERTYSSTDTRSATAFSFRPTSAIWAAPPFRRCDSIREATCSCSGPPVGATFATRSFSRAAPCTPPRSISIRTRKSGREGYVYVPAGPAIVGGDPDAVESLPRQEIQVGDFALARLPVTMREYCAFLDALQQTDEKLVRRRAPHDVSGALGFYTRRNAAGHWEPDPVIIEGDARKMFPLHEGHEWNVAVYLIDWFDAVAYCRWRGEARGSDRSTPHRICRMGEGGARPRRA